MRKQLILFISVLSLIVLVATSVVGEEVATPYALDESILESLEGLPCDEIFAHVDIIDKQLPPEAPFQNELINLLVLEGNLTGHILIDEGIVKTMGCGFVENFTYELTVESLDTIYDLLAAENPVKAYVELKDSGAITVQSTTFGGKIKLFFANVVAQFIGWFS